MAGMKEHVHELIISELQQNARIDRLFVLIAILLNFLILGINSIIGAVAIDAESFIVYIIFVLFLLLVASVDFISIMGLLKGRKTMIRLIDGLVKMYTDENVDQYYDGSAFYKLNRYNLFILAILITGGASAAVPLLLLGIE